ncbi:serine/threonine-protein phosphatase 4 regulatory subunit 1-like [Eschrichtius robustus]|uniref:serine/threonine-protein phosphatase 4 regulatory subunit 1-like n=1 Tax=Eschrichtius robustus TaxID=9764 RepID=UPI0035BEBB1F
MRVTAFLDVLGQHNLPALARLEKYTFSGNIFSRQIIARGLLDLFRDFSNNEEDFITVVEIVVRLSEDAEPTVRAELLEQIPPVAIFLQENRSDFPVVLSERLAPIVVRCLTDPDNQGRKSSQEALLILLEQDLIFQHDTESKVCPVLLALSAPDSDDEYRAEAGSIICKLASVLSKCTVERLQLPRFCELCGDGKLFQVRKVCATNFGDVCHAVGQEATEKFLLPKFFELCSDNAWGMRKACAECFVAVSRNTSPEGRRARLSPLFITLISDPCRWGWPLYSRRWHPEHPTTGSGFGLGFHLRVTGCRQPCHPGPDSCAHPGSPEDVFNNFLSWRTPLPDISKDFELLLSEAGPQEEGGGTPEAVHRSCVARSEIQRVLDGLQEHMMNDPDVQGGSPIAVLWTERTSSARGWVNAVFTRRCGRGWIDPSTRVRVCVWQSNGRPGWMLCVWLAFSWNEVNGRKHQHLGERSRRATEVRKGRACATLWMSPSARRPKGSRRCPFQVPAQPLVVSRPRRLHQRGTSSLRPGRYKAQVQANLAVEPVTAWRLTKRHGCSPLEEDKSKLQDIIPQPLLDQYVSMTDPARAQTVNTDIAKRCAYSLPGVALTLGRQNWHCLKDTYETLASDVQWKVLRTLAFSIHELAVILGDQLTAADLLPIFNGFLKDLDEVRIGVLKHLYDFLKLLREDKRREYLYQLQEFVVTDNSRNWRFRYGLAENFDG